MSNETGKDLRTAKLRSLVINILIFVAIIAGVRMWQHRDMVSGTAPDLRGVMLSGQRYTLPTHPAHPVLVHFWATWCPICRAEQGSIAALAHDDPDVITVAMQSGKNEEITRFMHEQGIEFPVVNDADGSISNAWGVHGVPASFIIAPDGNIRFIEVGYTTGMGLRLRLWLAGIAW